MIIAALFALLFAIAVWAAIYARGPWVLKLGLVLLIPACAFLISRSLDSYKGYPAAVAIPAASEFIACDVEEPDGHDPGRIYLWLIPQSSATSPLGYKARHGEPRSYREPYTRELHKACQAAGKSAAAGVPTGFASGKRKGPHGNRQAHPHPYVLPPPSLPRKNSPTG